MRGLFCEGARNQHVVAGGEAEIVKSVNEVHTVK
jgi:hypothetical protein